MAALPQMAEAGQLLTLHDGPAQFAMSAAPAAQNDAQGVKGQARLDLSLADVSTHVSGSAASLARDTNAQGNSASRSAELAVDSKWQRGQTAVNLKAEQRIDDHVQDGAVGDALYAARTEQFDESRDAAASVTVKPLPDLTVEAGAAASSTATDQHQWLSGSDPSHSHIETQTTREYAKANWTPMPHVALTAEGAMSATTMAMRGTVDGNAAWRAAEPRVSVTVKPWQGGQFSLTAERSVTPVNTANLAAYASASERPDGASLKPDSTSQIRASLSESAGPLSLRADVAAGHVDSTTVLMPAGSGQTPMSLSGGTRQSASATAELSLKGLGLDHTKISSRAMWRRSRITDPITGKVRRLSGEVPREASIQITQGLPGRHLKLGLEGKLGAETHYYQAAEETTVSEGASLGAFVQYDPGPFALRLNVEGIAGGTTREDAYYSGSRAGELGQVLRSHSAAPSVGLTLTKSLDG